MKCYFFISFYYVCCAQCCMCLWIEIVYVYQHKITSFWVVFWSFENKFVLNNACISWHYSSFVEKTTKMLQITEILGKVVSNTRVIWLPYLLMVRTEYNTIATKTTYWNLLNHTSPLSCVFNPFIGDIEKHLVHAGRSFQGKIHKPL